MAQSTALPFFRLFYRLDFFAGLVLTAALATAGLALSSTAWLSHAGISALTIAIVLGMLLGNTVFYAIAAHSCAGVDFSKSTLLKLGIILFGFRITFQDIVQIGWAGAFIAAAVLTCTFILAVQLGTRVFHLDKQTAMLIGAGSAICGAAAVMAAEPVVRGQPHKVAVAVATVVIFGTLAMFIYPLLYPYLGLSEQAFGVFVGSTVHEVAQVVAAGSAVSDATAATAVIEKMMRVMMLAPFLIVLSGLLARSKGKAGAGRRIVIPWFAVLFVLVAGLNSLQLLPVSLVHAIVQTDNFILAMAMAALGLRTQTSALREAGLRPLMLAATLFGFLLVGGYVINFAITHWVQ